MQQDDNLEVEELPSGVRAKYYGDRVEKAPDPASPKKHTMGEDHFLQYIGRIDPETQQRDRGDRIHGKKFSDEQKLFLQIAYLEGMIVRVIGAEKRDAPFLVANANRKLTSKISWHQRKEKRFNRNRAMMFFTAPENDRGDGSKSPLLELWVVVFPSPQYVDQIGELIQAIYADFDGCGVARRQKKITAIVRIWHFPDLERNLATWTFLESSLSSYLRHGDVVVIGNVELILPGIESVGYHEKFPDWQNFGINDMFGIQILVNDSSFSRIVLLGIKECYWGEGSARYVEALVKAGARHILYGSKAASMTTHEDIAGLRSPGSFSIYVREKKNQGLTQLNSTLTDNAALKHLAELAKIETVGIGVTVPTVIGENLEQRRQLENLSPSTMDDEDGHIARVVQDYNKKMESSGERVGFLPVHYISDYVHRKGERARRHQPNLANTNASTRDPAFLKIGSFFGVYATIYGLREYVTIPKRVAVAQFAGMTVQAHLESVSPLLNAGMVREAITSLAGSSRVEQLPSSNLQTIALICQKYGFVDDALNVLSLLKSDESWTRMSAADRLRMLIVETKLHTQVGRFGQAQVDCKNILAKFTVESLKKNEQYGSLHRRIALTAAYLDDWDMARKAFELARQRSPDNESFHGKATNDVFFYIACLARGSTPPSNWAKSLSSVRNNYLLAAKDAPVWQANAEKSALIALFVEAALHLVSKGIDDRQGLNRLFIAHLLNIRIGGSERSEGYGELIAFIEDPMLKDLFRQAMRMDGIGRKGFQRLPHTIHLLAKTQTCLDIFSSALVDRNRRLDEILARLDGGS